MVTDEMIAIAVAAERERCAKIASEWSITIMGDGNVGHREAEQIARSGFASIAEAILDNTGDGSDG